MFFFKKKSYKVKLRGNSRIEYVDAGRKMMFFCEFLAGAAGIVIYCANSMNWEPPHQNDFLAKEDLDQIKKNILEDLAKHGIKAEWS